MMIYALVIHLRIHCKKQKTKTDTKATAPDSALLIHLTVPQKTVRWEREMLKFTRPWFYQIACIPGTELYTGWGAVMAFCSWLCVALRNCSSSAMWLVSVGWFGSPSGFSDRSIIAILGSCSGWCRGIPIPLKWCAPKWCLSSARNATTYSRLYSGQNSTMCAKVGGGKERFCYSIKLLYWHYWVKMHIIIWTERWDNLSM